MEVALIRIDPNKNGDDGRPKIVASTVVDTNLKTADQAKPDRDDLLALTRTKFRRQFPGKQFPFISEVVDDVLKQWLYKLDPHYGTVQTKFSKLNKYQKSRTKVLVNAVALTDNLDSESKKDIIVIGDYVAVNCDDTTDALPKPDVMFSALNHFFLQGYFVLSQSQFKKLLGKSVYIPTTTKNSALASVKLNIEYQRESREIGSDKKRCEHSQTFDVPKKATQNDKLTPCCFRLPTNIMSLLKDTSAKYHTSMTHILIDSIVSKYGGNQTD